MADFSVTITVPNDKETELIDAMKDFFGQIEDPVDSGTFRDRTNQELKDAFAERTREQLVFIFERYKKKVRDQTPVDTVAVT